MADTNLPPGISVVDGYYHNEKTGEKAPRVSNYKDMVPKPWLAGWAAKLAGERAIEACKSGDLAFRISEDELAARKWVSKAHVDMRDKAADLGGHVHDVIEMMTLGKPVPPHPPEIAGHMRQFDQFLERYKPEFLMSEAVVWNRTECYAGKTDAVVKIDGRTLIFDIKTGKSVRDSDALQMVAYKNAEVVILRDGSEHPMPKTDGAVILHLRPRSWKLYEIDVSDRVWRSLLYCREMFRWEKEIAPHVVRGEVPAPGDNEEALAAFGITGEAA